MKTESTADKLTIADAAKALCASRWSVHRAIAAGKLEPVRGGIARRAYYVTRKSVEAILKGGAQ